MKLLPILVGLLGLPTCAAAQRAQQPPPAVLAVLARHPEIGAFLIARGDDIVDSGDGVPISGQNATAVEPWASVTKQVVAVMVMQQVEAGRLALDAPADRYLPQLRGATRPPTIRELLQHRSGLFNPDDGPVGPRGMPAWYSAGDDPLAPCLAGRGAPGAGWRYNNCDYLVLGRILERVTHRPLRTLFEQRIARPAGLTTAHFAGDPPRVAEAVTWTPADQRLFTRFGAAGGLVGSIADLQRFDRALADGRLLSPAARETLWRADPALGSMALGQWVFDAQPVGCAAPLHIVERRGGIGRYQVRNIIVPERNVVVILFARDENLDFGEIWQGRGLSHDVLAAAACG